VIDLPPDAIRMPGLRLLQARLPVDTGHVLELRPNCECCDRDLDPESPDVFKRLLKDF